MEKDNNNDFYPINQVIEEKIKNTYPEINWNELLFNKFGTNLSNYYIKLSKHFEFNKFLKAMKYEYGINNTKINLQKAYKKYKKYADLTTDSLSMYKMFQIHFYQSEKFQIKRNRNLEHYYLYKCYAYSQYHFLTNYIKFMGKIELLKEIYFHIQIEDPYLEKFDKCMKYLKSKNEEFNISETDIDLINGIVNLQLKRKENEGLSILNQLMIQENLEAIYKLACYEISKDKKIAIKLFNILYYYKYYKSYYDYGKFLFNNINDYNKGIQIFKEGLENGNYLCNFGFYDAFLYIYNFSFFENGNNLNHLKVLFKALINDILTGGIYSFLEFFFLKKICIKHFKVQNEFFKYFDIYIKELNYFLEQITSEEKKNDLRNNFSQNAEIEFNLVYGYILYLNNNLTKSIHHIKYAYKITQNKRYRRFCYSFIFKIRKKLIKENKISEQKMEKTKKKLFNLFILPFQEGNLYDFSSSFFYILAKLYFEGIGTEKNIFLAYVYYYQALNPIKKNLTGTIFAYYRQYKSNIKLKDKAFENIFAWINNLKIKNNDCAQNEQNCVICFNKKNNVIIIPCRHMFCDECIKKIDNEKCPICRGKMIQKIYLL